MSKKHAKNFADRLEKDEALRKKIRKASERFIKIGKDHGYTFTREELGDVLREKWGAANIPSAADDPDTCICFVSERPVF